MMRQMSLHQRAGRLVGMMLFAVAMLLLWPAFLLAPLIARLWDAHGRKRRA